MSGHFVWCDPPRCTYPDPLPVEPPPGDFRRRAGVHRSREISVRMHGGDLAVWLYATERGNGEPSVIVGGAGVPLPELRRVVAELESLTQPRRATDGAS